MQFIALAVRMGMHIMGRKSAAKGTPKASSKAFSDVSAQSAGTLGGDHEAAAAVQDDAFRARFMDDRRTDSERVTRILAENFPEFSALDASELIVDDKCLERRLLEDLVLYRDRGMKLTTSYFTSVRQMYMAKKLGLGVFEVQDKSQPVEPQFGAALKVMTSSKYLTAKSMSPMMSFLASGGALNQRCFVWLMKSLMGNRPNSPNGSMLWVAAMEYIKRRSLDKVFPLELDAIKIYMDEALVKAYSQVKGHVTISGFAKTHTRPLSLLLDVQELEAVLAVTSQGEHADLADRVSRLMSTNIGSELISFMSAKVRSAAFEKFISERLDKHGDNKLDEAFVEKLTLDALATLRQLGYEETCRNAHDANIGLRRSRRHRRRQRRPSRRYRCRRRNRCHLRRRCRRRRGGGRRRRPHRPHRRRRRRRCRRRRCRRRRPSRRYRCRYRRRPTRRPRRRLFVAALAPEHPA